MEPLVIRKEVVVDASPEAVWRIVATAEGQRRWFRADRIVLEPWPGGRYEEHAVYDGTPHHVVGSVQVYDPPHRFVYGYRAQRPDGTGWPVETTVTLTVAAAGARTRVVVEHSGFERLPVEYAQRTHQAWSGGWGATFERLPAVVREDAPPGETPLVVRREIEIEAPPERVWPYVATQEGYTRWTCTVAEVYEVVLEPRVGGRYEEHGRARGEEWRNVGHVLTCDPPKRFAFEFQTLRPDGSLSPEMTVTITLTDLGGRARVVLEHAGIDRLPADRRDASFRSFSEGWTAALEDLRGLLIQEVLPSLGSLHIYQTTEIAAPAERIWWYLATEEGRREHLRHAYPPDAMQVERFEAVVGGRWETAGISARTGEQSRKFGRVLTYDPPRLLVYTLQEEGWTAETTVTYRLVEYRGKTRVMLIHDGFERLLPARRERTRKAYEIGRFKELERIRDLVEGREVVVQYPITIRKELDIRGPIDRVWWYVASQEGSLRRHRAESVAGVVEYQDEVLEPHVGGRYALRGIFRSRPFEITGRVVGYDPPLLLALTWREADWPVDTLVVFQLRETGLGDTTLAVIHDGFEHLPREIRERTAGEYEEGRRRGLEVLRRLLEEEHSS